MNLNTIYTLLVAITSTVFSVIFVYAIAFYLIKNMGESDSYTGLWDLKSFVTFYITYLFLSASLLTGLAVYAWFTLFAG